MSMDMLVWYLKLFFKIYLNISINSSISISENIDTSLLDYDYHNTRLEWQTLDGRATKRAAFYFRTEKPVKRVSYWTLNNADMSERKDLNVSIVFFFIPIPASLEKGQCQKTRNVFSSHMSWRSAAPDVGKTNSWIQIMRRRWRDETPGPWRFPNHSGGAGLPQHCPRIHHFPPLQDSSPLQRESCRLPATSSC